MEIEAWLTNHVDDIRRLGPTESTTFDIAGRHFAGYECFDCDFTGQDGGSHCLTLSVCHANDQSDSDAQVVDSVSALTLIGMLLEKVAIKPTISAT